MEPLTVETFNPDMINTINLEQKKSWQHQLHCSKVRIQWR